LSWIDRLVLGTAQLGMPYGIANTRGQPDQSTADDILQTAWNKGIRTLDTAQAYGESEAVIGQFLRNHAECRFEIITKLSPDVDISDQGSIKTAVQASRERLGRPLTGLMLHRFNQLKAWNGVLGNTLGAMKQNGDIGCLGVSVYRTDEFRQTLEFPEIDWIQAPYNVFDQRLAKRDLLEEASDRGKLIFLRSVFLQGLLLLTPDTLPTKMRFASGAIKNWQALCRRHGLGQQMAALGFVLATAPGSRIVIGCESSAQVGADVETALMDPPGADFLAEAKDLIEDPRLTDPSTWPIT